MSAMGDPLTERHFHKGPNSETLALLAIALRKLGQSSIYYGLLCGGKSGLCSLSAVGFGHAVDRVNQSCLSARVPPQAGHPTVSVSAMAAPFGAVGPKK